MIVKNIIINLCMHIKYCFHLHVTDIIMIFENIIIKGIVFI